MTPRVVCCAGALALITLGCGDDYGDLTRTERAALVGGEPSGAEDDAVVYLVAHQPAPYGSAVCAGVLLAPNVLLTALHCVSAFDPLGRFSCQADGALDPDWDGGWIGETIDPAGIDVHFGSTWTQTPAAHGLRVFGSGSTAICLDDVALVVLDTALPSAGVPIRTRRPVVQGELMTVVAFGTEAGSVVGRSRRAGVPVLAAGPEDTTGGTSTVAPRTFLSGDGPCSGDNGAPALSDDTGAVAGVFAFSLGGDCMQPGTYGWFAEVTPFGRLLHDAFEFAGGKPVEEPAMNAAAPTPPATSASCSAASRPTAPGGAALLLASVVVALTSERRRRSRSRRDGSGQRGSKSEHQQRGVNAT